MVMMKAVAYLLVLGFMFAIVGCQAFAGTAQVNAVRTFTSEGMQQAARYSAERGGSAVLVMQHGKIIFEDYHNGADENTATHIHSATKGFWAALTAVAMEDGLIAGYDEVIADTITEWRNSSVHPGKNQITLSHLVSLTSGLSQDLAFIQGENPLAINIYRYVVNNLRLMYKPGSHFVYGPSHYYAFGVFLQRKLVQDGVSGSSRVFGGEDLQTNWFGVRALGSRCSR
ncbi:MAG TPA: beta-lactamase family protein [Firmicutes bacterium]|nr:beta-lactamase family protein [Bacillota bacterium]